MFPVTAEIEIPKIGSISGTVGNRGSGEIKHDSAKIFEEDFQKWIELFWESTSNLKIGTAAGWVLSLMVNNRICNKNLKSDLLYILNKMRFKIELSLVD